MQCGSARAHAGIALSTSTSSSHCPFYRTVHLHRLQRRVHLHSCHDVQQQVPHGLSRLLLHLLLLSMCAARPISPNHRCFACLTGGVGLADGRLFDCALLGLLADGGKLGAVLLVYFLETAVLIRCECWIALQPNWVLGVFQRQACVHCCGRLGWLAWQA
jgi:hypothetical protein